MQVKWKEYQVSSSLNRRENICFFILKILISVETFFLVHIYISKLNITFLEGFSRILGVFKFRMFSKLFLESIYF